MAPLAIVQFAVEHSEIVSLTQATHQISLFLLHFESVQLSQVVQRSNDLELLQHMLEDPNCPLVCCDMEFKHAVRAAITQNQLPTLQLLMQSGPAVHATVFRLSMSLPYAIDHGNVGMVQWLLEQLHGSFACEIELRIAARLGHLEILKLLVRLPMISADTHYFSKDLNIIRQAVANGHRHIVQFLLEHDRGFSTSQLHSLCDEAIRNAHLRLGAWLDELASMDGEDRTTSHDASQVTIKSIADLMREPHMIRTLGMLRDVAELQWLVDKHPDYEVSDQLLQFACRGGDAIKVQWLIKRMDLPKHDPILRDALQTACDFGRVDVVDFLIRTGVPSETLMLDEAAMNGHVEIIQFLQQQHQITRFQHFDKSLNQAARLGLTNVVKLCGPWRTKGFPAAVFWSAAASGNVELLQLLLATPHNISIYVKILGHAFEHGQVEVVKCLLQHVRQQDLAELMQPKFATFREEKQRGAGYYDFFPTQNGIYDMAWGRRRLEIMWLILNSEHPRTCSHYTEDFRYLIAIAQEHNHFPMLQWVHERRIFGFSKDKIGNAVKSGSLQIVRLYVEKRGEVLTSQHADDAASHGWLHLIKYFRGHDVYPTISGFHQAACRGHWRIVRFLGEHQSYEGSTVASAFREAARIGHAEVVRTLWSIQCQREHSDCEPDLDLDTAFRTACFGGHLRLVQWLVTEFPNRFELDLQIPKLPFNALEIQCVQVFLQGCINQRRNTKRRRLV